MNPIIPQGTHAHTTNLEYIIMVIGIILAALFYNLFLSGIRKLHNWYRSKNEHYKPNTIVTIVFVLIATIVPIVLVFLIHQLFHAII